MEMRPAGYKASTDGKCYLPEDHQKGNESSEMCWNGARRRSRIAKHAMETQRTFREWGSRKTEQEERCK